MATIKVDSRQIEDHLAQQDSIVVTSFNWSQNGFRSEPEIDWELSSDICDLEYEDEDFVDIEEHNKVLHQLNEAEEEILVLQKNLKALNERYDATVTAYNALLLSQKPWYQFW